MKLVKCRQQEDVINCFGQGCSVLFHILFIVISSYDTKIGNIIELSRVFQIFTSVVREIHRASLILLMR